MKQSFYLALFFAATIFICSAFQLAEQEVSSLDDKFKWYTWEEAMIANEKQPKKIIVDVYTDWCGWCKKMDATTFADPKVKKYLREHFYAVKLNAEQKEDIQFRGKTFKYVKAGRKGIHTLAYSLLDGKLGYPAFVYLNENVERIMNSPGFKDADTIMHELTFAAEEHYKKVSWDEYVKELEINKR